jgi:hypothetical protein
MFCYQCLMSSLQHYGLDCSQSHAFFSSNYNEDVSIWSEKCDQLFRLLKTIKVNLAENIQIIGVEWGIVEVELFESFPVCYLIL